MSSNGNTDVVLRGVTHGAVDFLIKPVRLEELRNAWQHVVRRKRELVRPPTPGRGGGGGGMKACTYADLPSTPLLCMRPTSGRRGTLFASGLEAGRATH